MKSLSWFLISLFIAFASHAEVRESIPDFTKRATVAIAHVDSFDFITAPASTKKSLSLDEQIRLALDGSASLTVTLPQPFSLQAYSHQRRTYSSVHSPPFHLLI